MLMPRQPSRTPKWAKAGWDEAGWALAGRAGSGWAGLGRAAGVGLDGMGGKGKTSCCVRLILVYTGWGGGAKGNCGLADGGESGWVWGTV